MSVIEIQRPDDNSGGWEIIPLVKIVYPENKLIVAGRFRILVDGRVVYENGGANRGC